MNEYSLEYIYDLIGFEMVEKGHGDFNSRFFTSLKYEIETSWIKLKRSFPNKEEMNAIEKACSNLRFLYLGKRIREFKAYLKVIISRRL